MNEIVIIRIDCSHTGNFLGHVKAKKQVIPRKGDSVVINGKRGCVEYLEFDYDEGVVTVFTKPSF